MTGQIKLGLSASVIISDDASDDASDYVNDDESIHFNCIAKLLQLTNAHSTHIQRTLRHKSRPIALPQLVFLDFAHGIAG